MRVTIAAVGAALALLTVGCASNARQPKPLVGYVPTILAKNVEELRSEAETKLRTTTYFELENYKKIGKVGCYHWSFMLQFNSEGMTITCNDPLRIAADSSHSIRSTHVYVIHYDELSDVTFSAETCTNRTVLLPGRLKAFIPGASAEICDVFYSLGQYYKIQREDADAVFAAQATDYRSRTAKPQMTEGLRRVIVQSEAARKRRDYVEAAELLRTALGQDAVAYPAGWFNLALLYEQQERYGRAIDAMRKYLQLQPGAQDARAAQDKIYEWEMLTKSR